MLLIVLNDSTTLLRSSSELWVCMSSSCPVSSFTHWTALQLCSGCWCNDLDVLQIGTRGMKQLQVLPSSSTASSLTILLVDEAGVPCSMFLAVKLRHCCSSSSCSSPPLWESPALQTTLLLPSWCTGCSFPFAFDLDYMLLSHMFLERLPSSYITTYNTAHSGLIIQLGLVSPFSMTGEHMWMTKDEANCTPRIPKGGIGQGWYECRLGHQMHWWKTRNNLISTFKMPGKG